MTEDFNMRSEDFGFDSGEYEYLAEAVKISANIDGACCEIGLRLGRGTATIIEAIREYCPQKLVISVDPFGSIPYIGREHVGAIRLDYDNPMKYKCLSKLNAFALQKEIKYDHYPWTDHVFFDKMETGVPYYDLEEHWETKYSVVHLDAQHTVADVSRQILWFNERMDKGSIIVIDDITIDFLDIKPINNLFISLDWSILKQGLKKGVYQKC